MRGDCDGDNGRDCDGDRGVGGLEIAEDKEEIGGDDRDGGGREGDKNVKPCAPVAQP